MHIFEVDISGIEDSQHISKKVAMHDGGAQDRIDIADHQSTSIEVLIQLTQDENADVRFALAENHNIDRSVLNLLVEDANPYVAHRARKTLLRLSCGAESIILPGPQVWTIARDNSDGPLVKRIKRA